MKINFNSKSIEEKIKTAAFNKVSQMTFEIKCPHCHKVVSASSGKQICPLCHKPIDLNLNINI